MQFNINTFSFSSILTPDSSFHSPSQSSLSLFKVVVYGGLFCKLYYYYRNVCIRGISCPCQKEQRSKQASKQRNKEISSCVATPNPANRQNEFGKFGEKEERMDDGWYFGFCFLLL
jgi:hypothetical protein